VPPAPTHPIAPPGVSADHWAPISDTLGVVMDEASPPASSGGETFQRGAAGVGESGVQRIPSAGGVGGAALIPPVNGYLMLRRGNLWQRLILVEPLKGPGAAG
jgi:hypothetical protein